MAAVQEVQDNQEERLGKDSNSGGVEGLSLSPNIGPPEATLWSALAGEKLLAAAVAASTITHALHIEVWGSLQVNGKEWGLRLMVDSGSLID